jgi:hypothetical protein
MQMASSIRNDKKNAQYGAQANRAPFFKPIIQPKLTIGAVDDSYEREADAVAERVMRMADKKATQIEAAPVVIQKKCAACEEEEKKMVQRKCSKCEEQQKLQMKGETGANSGMAAPQVVLDAINAGGQKLDAGTRGFMESRFGYDFGNVQIHNNRLAHQSSSAINALAYTHGNHVVFANGQYHPETNQGKQLLAHELTHVVQQNTVRSNSVISRRDKPSSITVDIGKVNAPDTPKGVNRIIPRKELDVQVKIKGASENDPVNLSISGSTTDTGSAKINGVDSYDINATETIKLKGVDQTEPGYAGKLRLVAQHGGKLVKQSNAFSVAAYPSVIGFNFNRNLHGVSIPEFPKVLLWGAAYRMIVHSDSDVISDCNKTSISENVIVATRKSFFKELGSETSDFRPSVNPQIDHHAVGAESVEEIKKEIDASDVAKSEYVAEQFYRFSCERTGIKEDRKKGPKVPTSGFKITKHVGKYFFQTQKEGFDNHGVLAGAVNDSTVKKSDVS